MLSLYYVAKYDAKKNEWNRLLVSAKGSEAAHKAVIDYFCDTAGRVTAPRYICMTESDVFVEL